MSVTGGCGTDYIVCTYSERCQGLWRGGDARKPWYDAIRASGVAVTLVSLLVSESECACLLCARSA